MKRLFSILFAALLLLGSLSGCGNIPPRDGAEPAPPTERIEPTGEGLRVYCFAAGKADAFLLYTDSVAVLIDAGESGFGKTIVDKCAELGIGRIDCLIITHFDQDHVGGAKKVLAELPVTTVLQSNLPKDSAEYEKYIRQLEECGIRPITVREEMRLTLGGMTLTVDPPARETYRESPSNNSSLITTVEYGATRLLFLGDAEDARLAEYISSDPPHCDFVKIPHHGRGCKLLRNLLPIITPQVALITSSDDEPEDARTREMLEEYGARTFLTRVAPVTVFTDGTRLTAQYDS